MNSKDMVLEYYKQNNLDREFVQGRIHSLFGLFVHLGNNGLERKDIDEELLRFIMEQITPPISDEMELLILESYLAHYVVNRFKKVFKSSVVTVGKEPEYEVEENYETIDVKPEDIPEKQYDLEFLKLIGVEDPE